MRTRVCITIDTEFSIGGAFADDSRVPVAEPNVWCNVKGRSEGLGFMLETFRRNDVQATFFVETAQRYYFKHDPMRPIVQRIQDDGHEIQLHTHPCWAVFAHADWRERVRRQQGMDNFHGRSVEDSVRLLEQGIDTFREWGLPRPKAFRSGNMQHDDNLFKALAQVNIPYSSNVGVGVFDTGNPDYALYSGTHERFGVLECPVLSYTDFSIGRRRHMKSLTIAGSCFSEMRVLLEQAHAAEIPLVVILTHPFEYVQSADLAYRHVRRHGVTQQRLAQLCEFLNRNKDRFDACGMARAADAPECRDNRNLLLKSPLWYGLPRMGSQVIYDHFGRWALACTRSPAI